MKILHKQQFALTPQMLKSILEVSKAADKLRTSAVLAGVCIRIRRNSVSIAATDGKILVDHKYETDTGESLDFGSDEFDLKSHETLDIIIVMSDKPSIAILKALSGLSSATIKAEYDGQTLKLNGNKIGTLSDCTYPKYEDALYFDYRAYTPPQHEAFRFGWDAKYMALIDKALSLNKCSHGVIIYPQGPGKGVILKPLHEGHIAEVTALIMPITIPEHR